MSGWLRTMKALLQQGQPLVRVVVASVRGSAPREPGATLLHWRDAQGSPRSLGSIGGGHLESVALERAEHMLSQPLADSRQVQRYALGASLGQCCGGWVELYWERIDRLDLVSHWLAMALTPQGVWRACALDGSGRSLTGDQVGPALIGSRPADSGRSPGAALAEHAGLRWFVENLKTDLTPLWLYGAGHVGRALVQVLDGLPFALTWIDSRPDVLEEALRQSERSPCRELAHAPDLSERSIDGLFSEDPADAVADAPPGAWHLVMTHSHEQDLRICEAALRRDAFGQLGLIGSRTKGLRFAQILAARGVRPTSLARLVTPIGIAGIGSKWPQAIAISVAAQLLQWRERQLEQGVPGAPDGAQVLSATEPDLRLGATWEHAA